MPIEIDIGVLSNNGQLSNIPPKFLEDVRKAASPEGMEVTLCYQHNGIQIKKTFLAESSTANRLDDNSQAHKIRFQHNYSAIAVFFCCLFREERKIESQLNDLLQPNPDMPIVSDRISESKPLSIFKSTNYGAVGSINDQGEVSHSYLSSKDGSINDQGKVPHSNQSSEDNSFFKNYLEELRNKP